jgi:hypothetical protein
MAEHPRARSVWYSIVVPETISEATGQPIKRQKPIDLQDIWKERMKGFEPSTFAMARRRSSQLSYIRALRSF